MTNQTLQSSNKPSQSLKGDGKANTYSRILTHLRRNLVLYFLLLAAFALHSSTIQLGTNVDEGVYWVEGREIAQGRVIYRDVQFNKPPLIALGGAASFVFGDTPIYPMRYGMILLSLLGLYGIYRLGRELIGQTVGLFALALFLCEPFSAIWAKYLHTSTWHPWFTTWILFLLISGLKKQNRRTIYLSGVVLGLYALCKQTAIYMLPLGLIAWLLFTHHRSWKGIWIEGRVWVLGILTLFAPFVVWVFAVAGISNFIYDIWTAHHLIADWFAHHTYVFRWNEFLSIFYLSPLFWLFSIGGILLVVSSRWKSVLFVLIWLLIEAAGDTLLISHVWRHYFIALMAPIAILGGAFLAWAIDKISQKHFFKQLQNVSYQQVAGIVLIAICTIPFWPRADWNYPGITLKQEQAIARQVERNCESAYLLNLTNPALYVWTHKQIPPVFQGERTTRIPYFMTLAGRGYSTLDDMERTVEHWKTIDLGCVVAYDKYIPQIVENPVMQPLEEWLQNEFQEPVRFGTGETYYGWVLMFEKKIEEK